MIGTSDGTRAIYGEAIPCPRAASPRGWRQETPMRTTRLRAGYAACFAHGKLILAGSTLRR